MARNTFHLTILISAICCLGVAVPGCQKDDIQTYDVPKPVEVEPEPPRGEGPKDRMLGAVIPHGEDLWFLKMQGPEEVIAKHKAAFDQVLKSFRFVDQKDKPVTWTTPTGWTALPETEMRYATLKLDDTKDAVLEMSITRLPRGGNVVLNVNRWRNQLGLNPVTAMNLSKVTTSVKLESGNAVAIDFVGYAEKSAMMAGGPFHKGAPPAGHPPVDEPAAVPFEYTVPNGWNPLPDKGGALKPLVAFLVQEGSQDATIKVTRLDGQISLAMNIERWREQVGLGQATPADLKDVREFAVGGVLSPYIDLIGPKQPGRDAMRMLAVSVTQGDSTLYFKMLGSAELVGRQKAVFEAFLSSVRFKGGSRG